MKTCANYYYHYSFSSSLPLLLYEVDVLEHNRDEVAAAASDVHGDVPEAELLLGHQETLLCHAYTVGHLKMFILSSRFKFVVRNTCIFDLTCLHEKYRLFPQDSPWFTHMTSVIVSEKD